MTVNCCDCDPKPYPLSYILALDSISFPLETLYLIKALGYQYSNFEPKFPVLKYYPNFKTSFYLGRCYTNMNFASLYEKSQPELMLFDSIKNLAKILNIEQFFDHQIIKNLVQKENHSNSVLLLNQENFTKINTHLQTQYRENLMILIWAGAWIESMYLAVLAYEQSANQKLKEKICEQKIMVSQILYLLGHNRKKVLFQEIITDFQKLEKIYISQFKQIGGSCVEMNDTDFENLRKIIKFLRNKIVK